MYKYRPYDSVIGLYRLPIRLRVAGHMSCFFWQSAEASWWRVCYQQGLPRQGFFVIWTKRETMLKFSRQPRQGRPIDSRPNQYKLCHWCWFTPLANRPAEKKRTYMSAMVCKDLPTSLQFSVLGAYYNGPKFKCRPTSGTGWFSYKLWTNNSETPMVHLLKNLRPFWNYIFKIQWGIYFLTFSYTDRNAPKKF